MTNLNEDDFYVGHDERYMARKKFYVPKEERMRYYGLYPTTDTYKDYIDDEEE